VLFRRSVVKKEISIKRIRHDAEEVFNQGAFLCSEAVVYSIRNNIAPEMPEAFVASASGFPVGVGGAGCICGAITGGVLCLGYFFGRVQPTTPTDPKSLKCIKLAYELQDSFKNKHKVNCCHVHLKNAEAGSSEHKAKCAALTGEMAVKTAEIIARELKLNILNGEDAPC
jgi:C_GCAxxG_C_C family probable redox protein